MRVWAVAVNHLVIVNVQPTSVGENRMNSLRFFVSTFVVASSVFVVTAMLPTSEASANTIKDIATSCSSWRFVRTKGGVVANSIQLNSDGTISGYSHPNEDHWVAGDNNIEFQTKGNIPSSRFESVEFQDGHLALLSTINTPHTLVCMR